MLTNPMIGVIGGYPWSQLTQMSCPAYPVNRFEAPNIGNPKDTFGLRDCDLS
jgi:hypothetical protein